MISTIFGIISNLMNSSENSDLVGAEAIVTDYHERKTMVKSGQETTGRVIGAERIVEEGVFQSNAVAQLYFDLGKYGQYPITLDLPDGPNDYAEIDKFMDHLGYDTEELETIIDAQISVPFTRVEGEWKLDWDEIVEREQ